MSGSHGSMPYPGPYCRHLDWAIGARFVVDRAHARPLGAAWWNMPLPRITPILRVKNSMTAQEIKAVGP